MKIGIFDSGIGGLNILSKMLVYYPTNEYIYYADNKNMPYGNKNPTFLRTEITKIMDYFLLNNVDVVIIACNTASTLFGNYIKSKYPFKLYLVKPNIEKALRYDRFTLLATNNTTKYIYKNIKTIASNCNISIQELNKRMQFAPSTLLAYLTETNAPNFYINYSYVRDILKNAPKEYPIILGCTHYTYYNKYIKSLGYDTISEIDYFDNILTKKLYTSREISNFKYDKIEKPNNFCNLRLNFTGKQNTSRYLDIIQCLL